jgi:MFS superfamily sulfate permease-like transporter
LAAVVIVAAGRLADLGALRRLVRVQPSAAVLSLVTTLGVVLLGVLEGIVVAVALSILVFFRNSWMPPDQVLGRVPGRRGWHDVDDHPDAATVPGVVIFRFEAPLFFANASRFRERVRELVDADPECRHLVLQCEAVTAVDVTAAEILAALDRELEERGIQLVFAELRDRQQQALTAFDTEGPPRTWRFHRSVKEALEAVTGTRYDELGLD